MTGTDSPLSGPASGLPVPFAAAAGLLVALHAGLGLLLYEPTLFPGGDNAGYLILGDALRSGEGYRDVYLPGAPLHAKYPPFLPSILAVLGWIGGVQLFKLAILACTSACVWFTARIGRHAVGDGAALVAAGLLALNPTLLDYGHYILSEAPFTLLLLVSLWAASRRRTGATALAIGAACAAFLTRTAGLTLLVALPAGWALTGRRKPALAAAAAGAAVMALWAVYQGAAAPGQASYLEELLLVNPYDPAAGSVGLGGLAARAAGNLWSYASRVVPQAVASPGAAGGGHLALGLALSALALAGWARRARRAVGPLELFVVCYVGLIAVWPDVWTDRRFLLPLLPVLFLLMADAVARFAEDRLRDRWRALAPAALLLAALPGILWSLERVPERVSCVAAYRSGRPCDAPQFASLYAAAHWAADNTPEDAIIANRKPRLFYWYSRRRGDLYPYSAEPSVVLDGLDAMGADYVVVDQVSGTTARYLVPAIQAEAVRFQPVYEGGAPPTFVFRLLPRSATAQ